MVNREGAIIFFQLLMRDKLLSLWGCSEAEFEKVEARYNLFGWIREQFDYLQSLAEDSVAEEIDRYMREVS